MSSSIQLNNDFEYILLPVEYQEADEGAEADSGNDLHSQSQGQDSGQCGPRQ
jgi:hypothetical protein